MSKSITLTALFILCMSFASVSQAKSIYTDTVQRVGSISDNHAVNRMESFLWGYSAYGYFHNCKPAQDSNIRQEAETAWLYIKYNSEQNASFINETMKWAYDNYECEVLGSSE